MIDKLQYRPEFDKAMRQVFGKTLIVKNLEVGTQLARDLDVNCITMDGDQVSRRGAITGGYVDSRHNRLDAVKKLKYASCRCCGVCSCLQGVAQEDASCRG